MAEEIRPNPQIDRLSSLHDSVLLKILAFLPIRDAISTSSLSSRFRRTWTALPALSFAISDPKDAAFVDNVLSLITTPALISIALNSSITLAADRINPWIDFAADRNVSQFKLNISSFTETLNLDPLYCSQTLKFFSFRAILRNPLLLPDPSSKLPFFAKLRVVKLQLAFQFSGDWIGEFVSRCGELEVLHLMATRFDVLKISCPKLVFLRVGAQECGELMVFCPKLIDLRLLVKEPMRNFRGEMPQLWRADVNVPSNSENVGFWRNFFKGIDSAVLLHLAYMDLKLPSRIQSEESHKHLPTLRNLRILILAACFHHDNIEFLVYLLSSFPKLKVLVVNVEATCSCVDKRKKWKSRKLESKVLENLSGLVISNGVRQKIINKSEFVKFLSMNVSDWKKVRKEI